MCVNVPPVNVNGVPPSPKTNESLVLVNEPLEDIANVPAIFILGELPPLNEPDETFRLLLKVWAMPEVPRLTLPPLIVAAPVNVKLPAPLKFTVPAEAPNVLPNVTAPPPLAVKDALAEAIENEPKLLDVLLLKVNEPAPEGKVVAPVTAKIPALSRLITPPVMVKVPVKLKLPPAPPDNVPPLMATFCNVVDVDFNMFNAPPLTVVEPLTVTVPALSKLISPSLITMVFETLTSAFDMVSTLLAELTSIEWKRTGSLLLLIETVPPDNSTNPEKVKMPSPTKSNVPDAIVVVVVTVIAPPPSK